MAKEIFDYSKVGPNDYTYYGFHLKDGRYHIDTKRLKKLHCDGSFPDGLFELPRNTHYFLPKHKFEKEWAINVLRAHLNQLSSDWNNEYKVAISKITTPKEVKENVRLNEIAYTSCVDDLEDIEFHSLMAGIKREKKYNEVIKSIHLQYIQKIFAEYFRALLVVIKERGYQNDYDFTFGSFCDYVQDKTGASSAETNPLFKLEHFKYFDLLNKIDNFLKHNTVKSYKSIACNSKEKDVALKTFLAKHVFSKKEAGFAYENGMYAGYWLKIGPSFVDEILSNLQEFSKELCKLVYDEEPSESWWNSDETLLRILKDNYFDLI